MPPRAANTMWWTRDLATVEDPISLEPLRKLRYPPFQCKTDPTLLHGTSSDWFDGCVLANYLVSTAHFVHPISRRDLTREECVALDHYCAEHQLDGGHVTEVFDAASAGDASVAQHRAEAETVLTTLFGRGAERRTQTARRDIGAAHTAAADGGLVVIDDDLRPGHAPAIDLSDASTPTERFPALAGAEAEAAQHLRLEAAAAWAAGTSGGQVMAPPPQPPPAPPPLTPEERAAQSRARRRMCTPRAWSPSCQQPARC